MTQDAILRAAAGKTTQWKPYPLCDAIQRHLNSEYASFHTPGHKGRRLTSALHPSEAGRWDVTELPGLDELSYPTGVLDDLETRASSLWGSQSSIISVNGASAGLIASMMALASRGSTVLVPRNSHRSILSGLTLSGLFPIWYDPIWDDEWGIWGSTTAVSAQRLIERNGSNLAGMVVVSPTYAGALSDIRAIADCCHRVGIPLVVDEAHGAHFLPGSAMPDSAVALGADVVAHSLHKTLPALTQTGLLHIGKESLISVEALRSALRLVQTSSPSYLLLASIEETLAFLERYEGKVAINSLSYLSGHLLRSISSGKKLKVYSPSGCSDPAHVLIGLPDGQPESIYDHLSSRGIFAETILGDGVLILLGLGTNSSDVEALLDAISDLESTAASNRFDAETQHKRLQRPAEVVQILSPRQALMMPSETVPVQKAVGCISAESVSPCPPGTPLVVAGQRIPPEILDLPGPKLLRVVVE